MPEIQDKFEIKCKKCGSGNIDHLWLDKYEDYVVIFCKDCKNEIEL